MLRSYATREIAADEPFRSTGAGFGDSRPGRIVELRARARARKWEAPRGFGDGTSKFGVDWPFWGRKLIRATKFRPQNALRPWQATPSDWPAWARARKRPLHFFSGASKLGVAWTCLGQSLAGIPIPSHLSHSFTEPPGASRPPRSHHQSSDITFLHRILHLTYLPRCACRTAVLPGLASCPPANHRGSPDVCSSAAKRHHHHHHHAHHTIAQLDLDLHHHHPARASAAPFPTKHLIRDPTGLPDCVHRTAILPHIHGVVFRYPGQHLDKCATASHAAAFASGRIYKKDSPVSSPVGVVSVCCPVLSSVLGPSSVMFVYVWPFWIETWPRTQAAARAWLR